jgi:hypothetical protein
MFGATLEERVAAPERQVVGLGNARPWGVGMDSPYGVCAAAQDCRVGVPPTDHGVRHGQEPLAPDPVGLDADPFPARVRPARARRSCGCSAFNPAMKWLLPAPKLPCGQAASLLRPSAALR